jgi:hypothetical protein
MGQVSRFVAAAKLGIKPERVEFACSKCTSSGHAHHFMCNENKRPKERDTRVKNRVVKHLRKVADAVKLAKTVRASSLSPSPCRLASRVASLAHSPRAWPHLI